MKKKIILLCGILIVICHSFGMADDTLRKKLGQLFIVGFNGPDVSDSIFTDLYERNLGGVILSYINGNLVSPAQIQQLIKQIDFAAQTPPSICADQEGGLVARLNTNDGFAHTYSAYTLGMVFKSLDSTQAQAQLMASWMNQCGFNLDLAPVVDVASSPYDASMYYQRRFSTDPNVVAAHAETFIDQFHAANIMTTIKHFPGSSGNTSTDLIPYRLLIDSSEVDMIMVGHKFDPNIDPEFMASLSHKAVQGLLRDSLGYQGVVITDDLFQMSTTYYYSYAQAAELAINAGDDILLYVGNTINGTSLVRQIIDTLETEVINGKISMARVNEAYNRILQLKKHFGMTVSSGSIAEMQIVPEVFYLSNFPNPFNPSTTIVYDIPKPSFVTLKIFDLLGREVTTLVNGYTTAGRHETKFVAKNIQSGVYFYQLKAGKFIQTKKMVLIK